MGRASAIKGGQHWRKALHPQICMDVWVDSCRGGEVGGKWWVVRRWADRRNSIRYLDRRKAHRYLNVALHIQKLC